MNNRDLTSYLIYKSLFHNIVILLNQTDVSFQF